MVIRPKFGVSAPRVRFTAGPSLLLHQKSDHIESQKNGVWAGFFTAEKFAK
jgi:hypothetical protein